MHNEGAAIYRWKENPDEQKFAEAWEKLNVSRVTGELDGRGTLDYLLANDSNYPSGEVSERDRYVAATVIQWLGSPCGKAFLRDI